MIFNGIIKVTNRGKSCFKMIIINIYTSHNLEAQPAATAQVQNMRERVCPQVLP